MPIIILAGMPDAIFVVVSDEHMPLASVPTTVYVSAVVTVIQVVVAPLLHR
jgi:hypothetical protein